MKTFDAFFLHFIAGLLYFSQCQVSPIWSTASVFSTGGGVTQLTSNPSFYTILFPIGFTISTSPTKLPFFGITGVD